MKGCSCTKGYQTKIKDKLDNCLEKIEEYREIGSKDKSYAKYSFVLLRSMKHKQTVERNSKKPVTDQEKKNIRCAQGYGKKICQKLKRWVPVCCGGGEDD